MDKKALRAAIRQQKRAMTEEEIVTKSQKLCQLLTEHGMAGDKG